MMNMHYDISSSRIKDVNFSNNHMLDGRYRQPTTIYRQFSAYSYLHRFCQDSPGRRRRSTPRGCTRDSSSRSARSDCSGATSSLSTAMDRGRRSLRCSWARRCCRGSPCRRHSATATECNPCWRTATVNCRTRWGLWGSNYKLYICLR